MCLNVSWSKSFLPTLVPIPPLQIEILTYCQLTLRQRLLYQALRNKISIEDLLQSSMGTAQQAHSTTSSLMNLVMQFRKVLRLNGEHFKHHVISSC